MYFSYHQRTKPITYLGLQHLLDGDEGVPFVAEEIEDIAGVARIGAGIEGEGDLFRIGTTVQQRVLPRRRIGDDDAETGAGIGRGWWPRRPLRVWCGTTKAHVSFITSLGYDLRGGKSTASVPGQ